MAVLNIPESQSAIFKKLSALTDQQFADLIKGLGGMRASLSIETFSKRLAAATTSIPAEDIDDYVTLLCGLYPVMENFDKSSQQVAGDIRETLKQIKRLDFAPDEATQVGSRMEKLLGIGNAIAVTAKALDVTTEHQNVFCGVKIYSDIRPIFSPSANSVEGAVVLHSLNISYHQGRDHKEIYFALEDGELNELKTAIERAEKKAKLLRDAISKSGINYLE